MQPDTMDDEQVAEPLTKADFEALARFRFGIRRYLRFSEQAVRSHGLTPQKYQLLLALKGYPGREWATLTELADRLQLRHHSVVELVNRAQAQGLVHRTPHPTDARAVRVELTSHGEQAMAQLGALHRDELRRARTILTLPDWGEPADVPRRPVRVRRIYDQPAADDGVRVLVDRVWPRGIRKEVAAIDEWAKDVAPSTELRKWYGHVPERFAQFEARYRDELATQAGRNALDHLRTLAKGDALTLVTATRDVDHSQAAVLARLLTEPH
jgi:uncharacterized protein YeaO (DUF488 family)/DNA-binding MarR family transcriptional regulator